MIGSCLHQTLVGIRDTCRIRGRKKAVDLVGIILKHIMEILYGHAPNKDQNDTNLSCVSQLFHCLGKSDVARTKAVVCCDLFLLYQELVRMKRNHAGNDSFFCWELSHIELLRDYVLIVPTGHDRDSFIIIQRLMKLFSITTKMNHSDLEQSVVCDKSFHKLKLDQINLQKKIKISVDCNDKTVCFRMECPMMEKIIAGAPLLAEQVTLHYT